MWWRRDRRWLDASSGSEMTGQRAAPVRDGRSEDSGVGAWTVRRRVSGWSVSAIVPDALGPAPAAGTPCRQPALACSYRACRTPEYAGYAASVCIYSAFGASSVRAGKHHSGDRGRPSTTHNDEDNWGTLNLTLPRIARLALGRLPAKREAIEGYRGSHLRQGGPIRVQYRPTPRARRSADSLVTSMPRAPLARDHEQAISFRQRRRPC